MLGFPAFVNAQEKPAENAVAVEESEEIPADVKQAFSKIAERLKVAKSTRATVELVSRAMVGSEELQSERAVYQIASQSPHRFTIFYKAPGQTYRVFADETRTFISLADDAYLQLEGMSSQKMIEDAPVPLGPYPEPVLALTLLNVDLNGSMLTNMKEMAVVNQEPLNNVPATKIHGVQSDGVTWDLWLSSDSNTAQPLRLVVDLSAIVKAESDELPDGFRYELDFLFTIWKLDQTIDDSYFEFTPAKSAKNYDSLDSYYQHLDEVANRHPLVGQPAPSFKTETLISKAGAGAGDDVTFSTEEFDLDSLKGKIVVLDMWATWCGPCMNAMPVVDKVAEQFKDKGVQFFALNVGEDEEKIREFLKTAAVRPKVLLDSDGEVATQYQVNAIPQMVIIGKDGRIEMVKVGWTSLETLGNELSEPLQILVDGGTLLTDQ